MRSQRVRGAESLTVSSLLNGPLRARGIDMLTFLGVTLEEEYPSIPRRNTSVSCEGFVRILQRGAWGPNKVVPRHKHILWIGSIYARP